MNTMSDYLRLTLVSLLLMVLAACEGDTREIVNTVDVGRLNLESIQIEVTPGVIPLNGVGQVRVTGTNKDGVSGIVLPSPPLLRSSNPSVATISGDGEIRGVQLGTATIQALFGGLDTSADIAVDVLTGIRVEGNTTPDICRTTTDLRAIGIYQVAPENDITTLVTWSSSPNARVESLPTGAEFAVTNLDAATLTATYEGLSDSLDVMAQATIDQLLTVTAPIPEGQDEPIVAVGSTLQFTALATWQNNPPGGEAVTQNVSWSAQQGNATINADGLATGINQGGDTAKATCASTLAEGTRAFIVVPPPTVRALEFYDPTLGVNNPDALLTVLISIDLNAQPEFIRSRLSFSDGTYQDVTDTTDWSSRDTSIVTVGNQLPDDREPESTYKGALVGLRASTTTIDIEYSQGGTEPNRNNIQVRVNGTTEN